MRPSRMIGAVVVAALLPVLAALVLAFGHALAPVPAAPRPGPVVVTPSTYGPPGPAGGPCVYGGVHGCK